MLVFLFGSEPIKQMVAKIKQADAARRRRMGAQIGRRASAKATYTIASMAGITVTEDTLYLVLYGDIGINTQRVDTNRRTAMHFQTNRIKMKTLMSLSIMALVLAGCTSAKHQQMQNERDIRRRGVRRCPTTRDIQTQSRLFIGRHAR